MQLQMLVAAQCPPPSPQPAQDLRPGSAWFQVRVTEPPPELNERDR